MMDFNLDSQTYGAIQFKSVVPASLAKWTMPGSQPRSAEAVFGKILMQRINTGTSQLVYSVFKIRKDLALDFSIEGPAWLTHIAWKNENRVDFVGSGPVYLKQGQFNSIISSSIEGTLFLEGGAEYETITILHHDQQLRELLPLFPFLARIVEESRSGQPV